MDWKLNFQPLYAKCFNSFCLLPSSWHTFNIYLCLLFPTTHTYHPAHQRLLSNSWHLSSQGLSRGALFIPRLMSLSHKVSAFHWTVLWIFWPSQPLLRVEFPLIKSRRGPGLLCPPDRAWLRKIDHSQPLSISPLSFHIHPSLRAVNSQMKWVSDWLCLGFSDNEVLNFLYLLSGSVLVCRGSLLCFLFITDGVKSSDLSSTKCSQPPGSESWSVKFLVLCRQQQLHFTEVWWIPVMSWAKQPIEPLVSFSTFLHKNDPTNIWCVCLQVVVQGCRICVVEKMFGTSFCAQIQE